MESNCYQCKNNYVLADSTGLPGLPLDREIDGWTHREPSKCQTMVSWASRVVIVPITRVFAMCGRRRRPRGYAQLG